MVPLNWIDANDLDRWADRLDAQARLPQVIRRLVHATVEHPHRVDFPAGESVQRSGWDGIVEAVEGNAFVPPGLSGWELSANHNVKTKAESDYQKRCKESLGVNPGEATFVFVTPRLWGNKDKWAAEKRNGGIWADVRAYDADNLEQWLELAPEVQTWFAELIGTWPGGAQSLAGFWEGWKDSTRPPMNAELHLAGREEAAGKLRTWSNSAPSTLIIQGDSTDETIAFVAAALEQMPDEGGAAHMARCVIVRNEQSWRQLVAGSKPLVLIRAFDDPDALPIATRKGHHILIPVGADTSASADTVQLPRLERIGAEKALGTC
jgi:hypothetical protein